MMFHLAGHDKGFKPMMYLKTNCIEHWMLISRAIYIENEDVNLKKGAQKQPQLSRPAYEHPESLSVIK